MENTRDKKGSCYHGTAGWAGSIHSHARTACLGSDSRLGGSSGFQVAKNKPCLATAEGSLRLAC